MATPAVQRLRSGPALSPPGGAAAASVDTSAAYASGCLAAASLRVRPCQAQSGRSWPAHPRSSACHQQHRILGFLRCRARRACKTPRWRSRRLASATTASWPRPSALAMACAVCSARRRSDVYMRASGSPCSAAASAAACSTPRALSGGSSWPCSLAHHTVSYTKSSAVQAQVATLQGPAAHPAALGRLLPTARLAYCAANWHSAQRNCYSSKHAFLSMRQHTSG